MDLLSEDSTVWIATMPAGSPGPEHTGTTVPKAAFADMRGLVHLKGVRRVPT